MTPDAKELEAAIVLMNEKLGARLAAAEAVLQTLVESTHTIRDGRVVPVWVVRYDVSQQAREYLDEHQIAWSPKK